MSSAAAINAPTRNLRAALALLKGPQDPTSVQMQAVGFKSLEDLARYVAEHLKMPRMELSAVDFAPDLQKHISKQLAERHRVIPVFASDEEITVATPDPARLELFDWLQRELKRQVIPTVITSPEYDKAMRRIYASNVVSATDPDALATESVSPELLHEAAPIVDHLILKAAELRASDIHIEAGEKQTLVRLRIDGMLREFETRPRELHNAIISRIKVMASLDISERAAPQDGRIKVKLGQRTIDLRVSILPTYFGEKVCCRLLDNSRASLPLSELGFDADHLAIFNKLIKVPYGLLLVTGPTGSGKSTTLYGALNAVRSPEMNIVSVEDPVEYQLPGINQVQVNAKRGLTFAAALRSILRQDPNVILVGEIRDTETGVIAAEAALTGHMVMASLHTNDAASAVTRLTEMGIEPYLVAPALVGVIAQRLMRKACEGCAEPYEPPPSELEALGLPALPAGTTFNKGKGCGTCGNTGYKGRVAVREILEVTDTLKVAIGHGAHADELRTKATAEGFRGMRYQALKKLFSGVTTADEVIRLTRS